MNKIQGLIAATFSSLLEDGSVNLEQIPAIVDRLVEDGLKGIFICGTNGEGPNLPVAERMGVAEAYMASANGRLLGFILVGRTSIAEPSALAAPAGQTGASAN